MSPTATAASFHTLSSAFHRATYLHSQPPSPVFPGTPNRLNLLYTSRLSVHHPQCSISRKSEGVGSGTRTCDAELRYVLELATDSELYDLERILFGPSYSSPLLKSLTGRAQVDYFLIGGDMEERDEFISNLESRFLYLAADARSTLRGWRPSYRNVLLNVRKKLKLPCSAKLSTEDLEAEIFLHLIQDCSREGAGILNDAIDNSSALDGSNALENGLSQLKLQTALTGGAGDLQSILLKGGGMLMLGKIYASLARKLSGKMFQEVAKYQIKNELIKKGGQVAAFNLESRMALLAAKQGVSGAATRYFGLRSMMTLLGPMLWGTLLADVVIQMLGTDYARILRAIYAFAQIRIIRTYTPPLSRSESF